MRDIRGFHGQYAITSCGRVYSRWQNRFLKPHPDRKTGYLTVELKGKVYKIHRLVAEAYLDNPNNYPVVHHKDENRQNNNVNNLEWCTYKANSTYSLGKPVVCLETGEYFESCGVAADKLNLNQGHISEVCNGKLKSHGKLHFEYVQDNITISGTTLCSNTGDICDEVVQES